MNEPKEPLCHCSVIRYVPDPVRDEPRNIGVLVLCPERGFAQVRFSLTRSGLAPASEKYRFLRSILESYQVHLPQADAGEFEAPISLGLDRLRLLHTEATNIVQFTQPLPAPGEPKHVLDVAYRDFVSPRFGGSSTAWTRGAAIQVFRRSFRPVGLEEWVKESAPVGLDHQPPFVFDFGIGNGRWHALIENASFRIQDAKKPEEHAAWMAFAWRTLRQTVQARALLFLERGVSTEAEARFERVAGWARDEGIAVYEPAEAPHVAQELARSLSQEHGSSKNSLRSGRVELSR